MKIFETYIPYFRNDNGRLARIEGEHDHRPEMSQRFPDPRTNQNNFSMCFA